MHLYFFHVFLFTFLVIMTCYVAFLFFSSISHVFLISLPSFFFPICMK